MKNQIQKIPKLSKNLTLTGMMGVGKSTIGKNLAKKLKYNFIDIDKLIEINEGSSINLIFRNKSEKYFRKIESEITLQELKKTNSVINV
jgi:shikimate kinase